jgi:hypothetical protein
VIDGRLKIVQGYHVRFLMMADQARAIGAAFYAGVGYFQLNRFFLDDRFEHGRYYNKSDGDALKT